MIANVRITTDWDDRASRDADRSFEMISGSIRDATRDTVEMERRVRALESELQGLRRQARALETTNRDVGASFARMGQLAAGAIGGLSFGVALGHARDYLNTAIQIENRLRLVTETEQERIDIQERLFAIANDTRNSFAGTAELYQRLADSTRDVNLSQEELFQILTTVNQATSAAGVSAETQSAGLQQFAQALAANRFQGDELRSVFENLPPLADAIAAGLGRTKAEVRELGAQGILTTRLIAEALLTQFSPVEARFNRTVVTLDQGAIRIENRFIKMAEAIDKAFDITNEFTKAMTSLVSGLDAVTAFFTDPLFKQVIDAIFPTVVNSAFRGTNVAAAVDLATTFGPEFNRQFNNLLPNKTLTGAANLLAGRGRSGILEGFVAVGPNPLPPDRPTVPINTRSDIAPFLSQFENVTVEALTTVFEQQQREQRAIAAEIARDIAFGDIAPPIAADINPTAIRMGPLPTAEDIDHYKTSLEFIKEASESFEELGLDLSLVPPQAETTADRLNRMSERVNAVQIAVGGLNPTLDDFLGALGRAIASGNPLTAAAEGVGFMVRRIIGYRDENQRLIDTLRSVETATEKANQSLQRFVAGFADLTLSELQERSRLAQIASLAEANAFNDILDRFLKGGGSRVNAISDFAGILFNSGQLSSVAPEINPQDTRFFRPFVEGVLQDIVQVFDEFSLDSLESRRRLIEGFDEVIAAANSFGQIDSRTVAGASELFRFEQRIQDPTTTAQLQALLQQSFGTFAELQGVGPAFDFERGVVNPLLDVTNREFLVLKELLVDSQRHFQASQDFFSLSTDTFREEANLERFAVRLAAQERFRQAGSDVFLQRQVVEDLRLTLASIDTQQAARERRALEADITGSTPPVRDPAARPAGGGTSGAENPFVFTNPVPLDAFDQAVDITQAAPIEAPWSDALNLTPVDVAAFGVDHWHDIVLLPGTLPKIQRFWSDVVHIVEREDEKHRLTRWDLVIAMAENPVKLAAVSWTTPVPRPLVPETDGKYLMADFNWIATYGSNPTRLAAKRWLEAAPELVVLALDQKYLMRDYNWIAAYSAHPTRLAARRWMEATPEPFAQATDQKYLMRDYNWIAAYSAHPTRLATRRWMEAIPELFARATDQKYPMRDYNWIAAYSAHPTRLAARRWMEAIPELFARATDQKYLMRDYNWIAAYSSVPTRLAARSWHDVLNRPFRGPLYALSRWSDVVTVSGAQRLGATWHDIVEITNLTPTALEPNRVFRWGENKLRANFHDVVDLDRFGFEDAVIDAVNEGRADGRIRETPRFQGLSSTGG